jgi:hypothetical protein
MFVRLTVLLLILIVVFVLIYVLVLFQSMCCSFVSAYPSIFLVPAIVSVSPAVLYRCTYPREPPSKERQVASEAVRQAVCMHGACNQKGRKVEARE